MTAVRHSILQVVSRIAAGIIGGYALTWGFIALSGMALLAAGLAYAEATLLARMLGMIVYLVAFCSTIAASRVGRAWVLLLGAGALCSVSGWLMSLVLT